MNKSRHGVTFLRVRLRYIEILNDENYINRLYILTRLYLPKFKYIDVRIRLTLKICVSYVYSSQIHMQIFESHVVLLSTFVYLLS
jgi:hypothetical protein